ncbi:hypothetical protein [Hyphobacterium sp.]|uniref:hypothetical protein n=1 Tax=Hyphobacterium sp. TaxID=2004662 RepID=UPI00374871A5
MAFRIIFPDTGNIVEVRLSGALGFDTIRKMHDALYFSAAWQTGMNVLTIIDPGVELIGIDTKTMRTDPRDEVERLQDVRGPDFKAAIVADNDAIEGTLREWRAMPFVDGVYDIEIFPDAGRAREWLQEFEADWPEFRRPA